jgi:hypothetical protein
MENKKLLTPIKAIKKFCTLCAGNQKLVRLCNSPDCLLYPYRLGHNVNRKGIGGNPNIKNLKHSNNSSCKNQSTIEDKG